MAPSMTFIAILILLVRGSISSTPFLGIGLQSKPAAVSRTTLDDIVRALNVKNKSGFEAAIFDIESLLTPIIAASPLNSHGRLDNGAARHALQRVFMYRHGWVLKHYDSPVGEEDSGSFGASPLFQFRGDIPAEVGQLLNAEVSDGRGSSITELATFAVVLEHIIAEERFPHILAAYEAHSYLPSRQLGRFEVQNVIDLHMACYISGRDILSVSPSNAFLVKAQMRNEYADWEGARNFFRSIEDSAANGRLLFTFDDVVEIARRVESNFPYFNNQKCRTYKDQLVEMEIKDSGRVPLSQFYHAALHDRKSAFLESVEYLRDLGALDESNESDPRVIISNYIEGPSNCVARSSYYSVCCVDECADLFSHLEQALQKAQATPAEIIPVVEDLSSGSMSQCRKLDGTLLQRLQFIAYTNNGLVPLHGKDFAEWMHFAYPRECSYSKAFGRAHYMTMEEWQEQFPTTSVIASSAEMLSYASRVDEPMVDWDPAASASWDTRREEQEIREYLAGFQTHMSIFWLDLPNILIRILAAAVFTMIILVLKFGSKGVPFPKPSHCKLETSVASLTDWNV